MAWLNSAVVSEFDCEETGGERESERGTNCEYKFMKSESCLAKAGWKLLCGAFQRVHIVLRREASAKINMKFQFDKKC